MATLNDLLNQYDQQTNDIRNCEETLARLKEERHVTAEAIKADHGTGPHEHNGRKYIVATVKGTTFLRSPLVRQSRKNSAPPANEAAAE